MDLEIKGTIKTIGETIEGGKGDKTWQKIEDHNYIITIPYLVSDSIKEYFVEISIPKSNSQLTD